MLYYSLNNNSPKVSFQDAVIKGLAPDKGLYFPEEIEPLETSFFENIESYSNNEIAFELIKQFVGYEIPTKKLKEINSLLPEEHFFRIHNSFIINLNKLKQFIKSDGYVILEDNHRIPVSRQKKSDFLEKF